MVKGFATTVWMLLLLASCPSEVRADCNEINYITWKLIADGSVEELKSNLEIGKSNGCTPWRGFRDELSLVHAAKEGNYEAVKLLIEFEIDINAENRDYNTALDYVAESRDTILLELLLKGGATVQWQSMQLALENGYDEIVGRLAAPFEKMDQALVLFLKGEEQRRKFYQRDEELLKAVKVLIQNGADVDRVSGQFTPLTAVAWSYMMDYDTRLEVAGLLIDNGADVNLKDARGNNALLICSASGGSHFERIREKSSDEIQGNYEFVKMLLDRGATTFVINDSDHAPPLALALISFNFRIAFLLGWKIGLAFILLQFGLCFYKTAQDIRKKEHGSFRFSKVAAESLRFFSKVFSLSLFILTVVTTIILVTWLWGYL